MKFHHLLMVGILTSYCTHLSAQNYKIEEIVVKEKKDLSEGDSIEGSELERSQADDLEDMFRHSPEVIVGGSQASAQKVYVRGIEDVNLNITIDGARQGANLFHHQGSLIVAPELLKRVDINPGTGSALQGPGALGGSIKMTTKDPADLLKNGEEIGVLTKLNYASNAQENGASAAVYGKLSSTLSYLGYGTYSDMNNYSAGGGDEINYTAASPKSLLTKLVYSPDEKHKLKLSFQRKEDNAKRSLRNHFGDYDFNPPSRQDFTNQNVTLNYDFVSGDPFLNLHVNLYNTDFLLRRYGDESDSETTWNTKGGDINNLFILEDNLYTLGADFTRDHSIAKGANGSNDELGEIFGVYQEFIHQTTSKLVTTAGLRFDHYQIRDIAANKYSQSHFSPSIALSYKWNEKFKTDLSWAEAFEGVTPAESLIISSAEGVAPLKKELNGTVSQTTQAGVSYQLNNYKLSAVLYRSELRSIIESSRNDDDLLERSNGEDMVSKGYTLRADYYKNNTKLGASFTSNQIKYDGEHLGYFAFMKGSSFGDRLNLYYGHAFIPEKLSLRLESLIVLEMEDVPEGSKAHPGYDIHDLSLTYQWTENTNFILAIHNIFDKKYMAHGTPYTIRGNENTLYEPGRDVRLQVSHYF